MQPVITIFCPFTRQWAIKPWLDCLGKIDHDPKLTNLCFIVDRNDHGIANQLRTFGNKHDYRSTHIKINEDWAPNEVRIAIRRMRVADIHNQSKDLVALTDGEIIIGLEDDTVFFNLGNFEALYRPILEDTSVGFVEGVQMGRWGANMVGVWKADDPITPTEISTMLPEIHKGEFMWQGIEEISGGGWYGYATRRNLYLNCDYYSSSSQPWGPDVNYGFYVQSQGYKCMVDWSVIFGHMDFNKVLYPNDPRVSLAQVIFKKDLTNGKWMRTDNVPNTY